MQFDTHLLDFHVHLRLTGLTEPALGTESAIGSHHHQIVKRAIGELERSRQRQHTAARMHRKVVVGLQQTVVDLAVDAHIGVLGDHPQDALVQLHVLRHRHRVLVRIEHRTQVVGVQHTHGDLRGRVERDTVAAAAAALRFLRYRRPHVQPVLLDFLAIQYHIAGARANRQKSEITHSSILRLEQLVLVAADNPKLDVQIGPAGRNVHAQAILGGRLHGVRFADAVLRNRHIVQGVCKSRLARRTARRWVGRCRPGGNGKGVRMEADSQRGGGHKTGMILLDRLLGVHAGHHVDDDDDDGKTDDDECQQECTDEQRSPSSGCRRHCGRDAVICAMRC